MNYNCRHLTVGKELVEKVLCGLMRSLISSVVIIVCIVFLFGSGHKVAGQKRQPPKPAGLDSLRKYVGKIANDKILVNPIVRKELIALMGASRYKLLDHYMLVQSGVDMISGDIVASGCAPHECGDKSAVVVVQLETKQIHAAIFQNETVTVYSKQKTFEYLPNGLTDWVTLLKHNQLEYGVRVKVSQK